MILLCLTRDSCSQVGSWRFPDWCFTEGYGSTFSRDFIWFRSRIFQNVDPIQFSIILHEVRLEADCPSAAHWINTMPSVSSSLAALAWHHRWHYLAEFMGLRRRFRSRNLTLATYNKCQRNSLQIKGGNERRVQSFWILFAFLIDLKPKSINKPNKRIIEYPLPDLLGAPASAFRGCELLSPRRRSGIEGFRVRPKLSLAIHGNSNLRHGDLYA